MRSTIYTLITVSAVAVLVATLLMPVLRIYGMSMSPGLTEGNIVVSVKTSSHILIQDGKDGIDGDGWQYIFCKSALYPFDKTEISNPEVWYNEKDKSHDDPNEEFIPNEEGKVKLYTCGPTVYSYAHIGNMRSYVGHDILDRTLRYIGYNVKRAMNITDVGHLSSDSDSGVDKMVVSAQKANKSVLDIAKFYTDAFFVDFDLLHCRKPDIVSPATNHIDDYIKIIANLLEKEIAYIAGGNVYFDTSKLKDYYYEEVFIIIRNFCVGSRLCRL